MALLWALAAAAPAAGAMQVETAGEQFERVQYVLDSSSSMRARFGESTKFDAAREMLQALDRAIARHGSTPEPALWTYGARSDRRERNCRDAEALARGRRGALGPALAELSPRGVSPLVFTLGELLASATRGALEAWVLFTDGSDSCDRDPCDWAGALAPAGRPRIYVVGLALEDEDARAMRCLTENTSGYLLNLGPGEAWQRQLNRLAAVIQNRGTLRVDVRAAGAESPSLQGRLFRAGSEEAVRAIRTGRDEEVPSGMYRLVIETLPPTAFDRVIILPGGEHVVTIEALARLTVTAYSDANEPLPAYAALHPEQTGDQAQYFPAGQPVYVRAGRYHLALEVGDSVALRETLELVAGEVRTVSAGGTGYVVARALGLPPLADVEVELFEYGTGRSSTFEPWKVPVQVPAGEYRAVVRSLPVYVQERFTVAPADTSSLVLSGLGTLQVDVADSAGRPLSLPVTLLRPEEPGADDAETAPGVVLGTFLSGVRQAVMAGTYDLLLETVPSIFERGVRIDPGAARVISLSLPGASGGSPSADSARSPDGGRAARVEQEGESG